MIKEGFYDRKKGIHEYAFSRTKNTDIKKLSTEKQRTQNFFLYLHSGYGLPSRNTKCY